VELKGKQKEEMLKVPIVLGITFFKDDNGRIGQITKIEQLYSDIVGEKALNRIRKLAFDLGDVMIRELVENEACKKSWEIIYE